MSTDKSQTGPTRQDAIEPALSEMLLLSVEWREAALSEIAVTRKALAITRLIGRHGVDIVAMARVGQRALDAATYIGPWLSAALDDPNVCDAMKADIRAWMEAMA